VKAIKSDCSSDSNEQKRSSGFFRRRNKGDTAELATKKVFQEKNRGVTPSVAAPGVTHPSDATAGMRQTDRQTDRETQRTQV